MPDDAPICRSFGNAQMCPYRELIIVLGQVLAQRREPTRHAGSRKLESRWAAG